MDFAGFMDKIKQWDLHLASPECRFVGEISLGNEELYAEALGFNACKDNLIRNHRSLYETALLVLAVNCAYHNYDDSGFWCHFSDLLELDNTQSLQADTGRIIERKLAKYGFLRIQREGSYRYVGALLEQCGVSRKYIPHIAKIIKDMKAMGHSWHYLCYIDSVEMNEYLRWKNYPHYLQQYLEDQEGCVFFRQVATRLQLLEKGLLSMDDLRLAPGYQKDFWDVLLDELDIKSRQTFTGFQQTWAANPRMMFSPEECCVTIAFPSAEYIENIEEPTGIEKWSYPVTKIVDERLFSEAYSGMISSTKSEILSWRIKGWIPDGKPVVFDIESGLVQRGKNLVSGEYYLLYSSKDRPSCEIIEEFGKVDLESKWPYRACLVAVVSGDLIEGYVTEESQSSLPELSWIDSEEFKLNGIQSIIDVFVGQLPAIGIKKYEQIEKGKAWLFFETNKGNGRIKNQFELEEFRQKMEADAPLRGRLFLFSPARNGGLDFSQEEGALEFVLLPNAGLKLNGVLHAFNSEPLLTFVAERPVTIAFPNCVWSSSLSAWKVPFQETRAIGRIDFHPTSLEFSVPIYRVRIFSAQKTHIHYIVRPTVGEVLPELSYLTGPALHAATLAVGSGHDLQQVSFDSRGICILDAGWAASIFEQAQYPIDELVVVFEGRRYSTGTILVDWPAVEASLSQDEPRIYPAGFSYSICDVVKASNRLWNTKTSVVAFEPFVLDAEVSSWFDVVLACSQSLDKTSIIVGGIPYDAVAHLPSSACKTLLEVMVGDETKPIDHAAVKGANIPRNPRWERMIADALNKNSPIKATATVREWSEEVKYGHGAYRSKLAGCPQGRILSDAWRKYRNNDYVGAQMESRRINTSDCIVAQIKMVLDVFILLRNARFKAALGLWNETSVKDGKGLSPVGALVATLSGCNNVPQPSDPDYIQHFPLMDYDVEALQWLCCRNIDAENEINGDSRDWLYWWLVFQMGNAAEKRLAAAWLIKNSEMIPNSPERSKIIEEVKKV